MRWIIFDFSGATTWLSNLLALINQFADFFAAVKEVWLIRRVIFAARPKRETERRFIPSGDVVLLIKHIADRQVPILIDVVDKVVYVVRAGLVGMDLRDFHLAGEKCHVAAHQFIPHLDRAVDRAGVGNAFVFRNAVAAAAFRLPPITFLRLLGLTIVFDPRAN